MNSKYLSDNDLIQQYISNSPELQLPDICSFFEALSRRRRNVQAMDIRPGDLIIRRQYGHHQRAWCGIVQAVQGDEALVVTREGIKRVKLYVDNGGLNWELRRLRPGTQAQSQSQPIISDFEESFEEPFSEDAPLPAGMIVPATAEVYKDADATSTKIGSLAKDGIVQKIPEKKQVNSVWWYKIEFTLADKPASGWTLATNVLEIADPSTFKFVTPGGSGSVSSFEKLREAVDAYKILPEIARHINYTNLALLQDPATLPDLIRIMFYHAIVAAKGDFKKTALIITAAVRSFKEVGSRGTFAWVQSRLQTTPKVSIEFYRDKIWHFFWNCYEIFTGTGSTTLDFKGIMYELKSRPNPIRSALSFKPLDKDSKSDIVFNRGGVMYAEWVNKNQAAVYKYHSDVTFNTMLNVVDQAAETKELTFNEKKALAIKIYEQNEATFKQEILKQSYIDFADYAAQAVENVLKAVATIPEDEEVWTEDTENADKAKEWNEYNPAKSDTIVINLMEFNTGIAGIRNYKDWKTNSSIIHNRHKNAYRDPYSIRLLVLHETAADTGDGFGSKPNINAHLTVKRDATILQFNDLAELQNHGWNLNEISIGIEFVNRGWLSSSYDDGGEGIPAYEANLTASQKNLYKEANGYLWCFWGYGFNIYRVPPSLDQLEKEVELVNWITNGLQQQIQNIKGTSIYNLFPWIDQEWLQLISYDDVKDIWTFKAANIPTDTAAKNYFVFTTGYQYLVLDKLKTRTGILSHNSFYDDHSDGSFLTLYTWLRLKKGKDKAKAYELCKTLMKNHHFMVSVKNTPTQKIFVLDVSDANLV